ncbi:MAG: hypothetical protein A3F09_02115 [Chlamydiae bacterium RIFCSPHIGHO2_12_FULL_49_11]|nr:MAG: hypothetical protein A3F09_02115 [Chlamydiae bacterium RIFCSPHIGHO2_12_FULL_49_11]
MLQRYRSFPYLSYFFLCHFSLAVVFPIFSVLVFREELSSLIYTRAITLGLLIALFPLAQMASGYLLLKTGAALRGARGELLICAVLIFLSFIGLFVAIKIKNLSLLFLFRGLSGAAAGGLFLSENIIITGREDHVKAGRLLTILTGLGLMAGVLAGGFSDLLSLQSSVPFIIGCLLALISITALYMSGTPKIQPTVFHEKKSLTGGTFRSSFFFFAMSWLATLQFFSLYVLELFSPFSSYTPLFLFMMSLVWLMGALSAKMLGGTFSKKTTLFFCLTSSFLMSLLIYFQQFFVPSMFFHLVFCLYSGLAWSLFSRASHISGSREALVQAFQNQKVALLAATAAPLIMILFTSMNINDVYLSNLIMLGISTILLILK